jgi:predicted dinucleotide-binding enzyme
LAFALRLHGSGYEVMIGSCDVSKAVQAASSIGDKINGASNLNVAAQRDVTFIAVPYGGHRALLQPLGDQLRGKVVIATTVPINPANMLQISTESGKSAAEETAAMNLKPINAGTIEISQHLERMTVLLLSINKANKVKERGIEITGI